MSDSLDDWFVREILSQEAALTRYLTRAWSNAADVPDLRQEVYVKVLQSAEKSRPAAPRYFLSAVARNLLADHARRKRIVPIDVLQESDLPNVLVDEISSERRTGSFQQLQRLTEAFERLPDRCREVVWLRKVEDLSQKDIAERLKIAEGTVESHLVRGMRLLAGFFHGGEGDEGSQTVRRSSARESRRKR